MNKIKVLDDNVINKISAGEVVDSPYSIIKELVENSIDAKAKKIIIEWLDGGISEIKIVDDGIGMSQEDAFLSLERYATSKIHEADDLYSIHSYGFRGEALASIASVSYFTLHTCNNEENGAVKIEIAGGEIVSQQQKARPLGTTIRVKELFYNQPVRKKFLKSVTTESNKNIDISLKIALANPDIHFTIIRDNKLVYDLYPVVDVFERFLQVYKKIDREDLIFLDEKDEYYRIKAIISHPRFTYKTRKYQMMFVNKRWVQYKNLGFILREGYINIIPHDRNALAYIFIEIDPSMIEVNIHPTKREIKFYNENSLIKILIKNVKFKLSQIDKEKNILSDFSNSESSDKLKSISSEIFGEPSFENKSEFLSSPQSSFNTDLGEKNSFIQQSLLNESTQVQGNWADTNKQSEKFFQAFNKYIITTVSSGLIIVDQHAAHERILYDEAIKNGKALDVARKNLMFPETIELELFQYEIAISNIGLLKNIGFEIKDIGNGTIILESCPESVKISKIKDVFNDILDDFVDPEYLHLTPQERMLKSYSCKAAIKFGDPLTIIEMEELIRRLFATTNPSTCPHGRPIIFKMGHNELASKFNR